MGKQIYSMTGFGRGAAEGEGIKATVELRSVNGRFLDLRVRLARPWAALEAKVRDELSKNFGRGTIDVSISLDYTYGESAVQVDRKVAETYAQEIRRLARELGTDSDIATLSLLKLPGVLKERGFENSDSRCMSVILSALAGAIAETKAMRAAEGARALTALNTEVDELEASLARVSREAGNMNAEVAGRLQTKLDKILGDRGIELDAARLMQEVGFYVERGDVTEEIGRLKGHLDQVRQDVTGSRPLGKRLDFLIQEMAREVNTLGAKSTNLNVVREIMEMKLALDRMREQVQNLE